MKKVRTAAIFFLAVLVLLAGQSNADAAPTIKDIRFESPTVSADRIIFELNGPHIPTGKALPGDNPRVYFDFPGAVPANKIKNRMPVNGNFVKQIRYAYHKGPDSKTRVVLDLVANQKMDFRQDFDNDTYTLVVTLYLAGTEPEPAVMTTPEPVKTLEPEQVAPVPVPEPVAMPEPEPEPPAMTVSEPEQPAMTAPESIEPAPAMEDEGKQMQQIEDVGIAAAPEREEMRPEPEPRVPPQAQELIPGRIAPPTEDAPLESAAAEPVVSPEVTMEPAAVAEPAPSMQEESSQIASIVPSTKTGEMPAGQDEEATVIQPMSEIGYQEQAVDDTAPILQSIEFDPQSNRGEMISFRLNGFHPPVVFGIEEDLPRIVCFFKNATAGPDLRDMIGTNGQYVKNIKVGKYKNPDNIRVVLELVPGNNYDLQQIFFKDDKVFMMIINKAGKQISTQSN